MVKPSIRVKHKEYSMIIAVLKPERIKLEKALPEMFVKYGLVPRLHYSPQIGADRVYWTGFNKRFECHVTVHPIIDETPWLACRFDRPTVRGVWQPYGDIRDHLGGNVNPFSGKYNCHIFERVNASEALEIFERHIQVLCGPK